MPGLYLLLLLCSIAGLATLDWRCRLAFFHDAKRAARIVLLTITVFAIWDILGILSGIFFIGDTNLLIGVQVGEFPLEEVFFLLLLSYTSLLVYLALRRREVRG